MQYVSISFNPQKIAFAAKNPTSTTYVLPGRYLGPAVCLVRLEWGSQVTAGFVVQSSGGGAGDGMLGIADAGLGAMDEAKSEET